MARGAGASFTLSAMSGAFDAPDRPLDPQHHASDVTDLIMRMIIADSDG